VDELKVLLVDDEAEFVSALAERLSMRKMQVRTASNGMDALKLIESDPPQIVVLDLMMPGMNGIEVLEQIKARYSNIPVILLTGMGAAQEAAKGMSKGAFDYLAKPFDIDQLIERMGEAISSSEQRK
jgi:two-component system, OmpR family, response regulator